MHLVTILYKTSNQDYSLIIDLRYICDWCCAMLDQTYQPNLEYAAVLVILPETVCWHTPVHTDVEGKITLAVTILVRKWGCEWISGLTQKSGVLDFSDCIFLWQSLMFCDHCKHEYTYQWCIQGTWTEKSIVKLLHVPMSWSSSHALIFCKTLTGTQNACNKSGFNNVGLFSGRHSKLTSSHHGDGQEHEEHKNILRTASSGDLHFSKMAKNPDSSIQEWKPHWLLPKFEHKNV